MIPRGLTRTMVAAGAVLLAVVAVVFAVLLTAIADQRSSSSWARHSERVLALSNAVERLTVDLETGERGYLVTRQQQFLAPWHAARAALPSQLAQLEALVSDNPEQEMEARGIDADVRAYINDWSVPIVTEASSGRLSAARRTTGAGEGKRRMDAVRAQFRLFDAHENALADRRRAAASSHAQLATKVGIGAFAALVLALLVFTSVLARSIVLPVRRIAAAAARLGRGELSTRVDERGRGEVRDLAQAFNRMATGLRDSRDELETQNRELETQQIELEEALGALAEEKEQVDEFRRFIELVSREHDPERLADTVLTELCGYMGAPVGTLYGVDGDHGAELTCLSALGVDRSRLPDEILPGEGFAGRAAVERKIVTAGFGEEGLRLESFGHEVTLGQELHIPLIHGEQTVGVVTLGRTAGRPLTPVELERIRYLTTQAAVGLSHAFALRRARNQAALNRAVLDSAYDAFVSFDDHGVVTAWNPRAEAVFGWTATEAVGRELIQLIVPPADRDSHRQSLIRFMQGEESELLNRRVEVTARHRDGHDFPVEIAISPIELDGAWRFAAFVHDISERRLLEERSGRLFSISLDFMCTFTRDGRFRQINPAWSQVLGWSEEQLLGTPMIDFVHPDDRERTLEQSRRIERKGEAAADFENRWRCADGSYRWLLWSTHFSRAEDLVYAVAKDVTEIKRSERFFQTRFAVGEALARADTLEEDMEGVLAAAGESLGWELGAAWLPDADGRVMRCSRTWGAPGEDPSEFDAVAQGLELQPGQGLVGEAWKAGEPRWVADLWEKIGSPEYPHGDLARKIGLRAAVAVPLVGADGVVAVIQLFAREPREPDEDALRVMVAIGEQVGHAVYRRLARIEADRMKDEFLALVSHELRTPLTSIVGYLELLGEDDAELGSDQGRRFLEVIERNAMRLQRLVDDVLFAARAEAGRLALAARELDLGAVAHESVAAARPKAEEGGVKLSLDADSTPTMAGDPDRLGQALDNLISNALKFTPPGGRVDVRVRNLGRRVRIEVRDTGLGMAEEDRARVFDRFFRAASTRDHVPGVGLGLTIVKTIVEGHGGTIAVTSSEGAGTTFRIELPLAASGRAIR